jgi:hypothetical protein
MKNDKKKLFGESYVGFVFKNIKVITLFYKKLKRHKYP